MKKNHPVIWGVLGSAMFGIVMLLVIKTWPDVGWQSVALRILLWPATMILLIIGFIFQTVSIRIMGPPVYVIYMCILGYLAGYLLNKLYSRIKRRRTSL